MGGKLEERAREWLAKLHPNARDSFEYDCDGVLEQQLAALLTQVQAEAQQELEEFACNWRMYLLAEREYFSKMDELETMNNHEQVARAWCRGTAHVEDNLGRITELLRIAALEHQVSVTGQSKDIRSLAGVVEKVGHQHTSACFSKVPETEGKGEYLSCGKVAGDKGK